MEIEAEILKGGFMKTDINKIIDEYTKIYINILQSYYPAKRSVGFTERNQSVNFTKAIEKIYPTSFSWFEVPFEDKSKNHYDAMVIIPENKEIFIIESKRFSDGDMKVTSVGKDIMRIDNKKNILGAVESLANSNEYSVYGVILADVWTVKPIKTRIRDTWNLKENNFFEDELFVKKLNLDEVMRDRFKKSVECMEQINISNYVKTLSENSEYNLLICIWKTES